MRVHCLLATLLIVLAPAVATADDPCEDTSNAALNSCKLSANSGFWIAQGNCDNVTGSTERSACRTQAQADLTDAEDLCTAQFNARQAACEALGDQAYDPKIDPNNFVGAVDNPFFPLVPGTTFIYEGKTADGLEHNEVTVTNNHKIILGVSCTEVHDTVAVNGKLTEDTLDWYAQDKDGNVWYFGENSKELEDGLVTSIEGSWLSGVDSAKPGIIMKAHPQVGDFYRQEFQLDNAEDLASVVSVTAKANAPAASCDGNCVKTKETAPLEPDALEFKYYAPGIGFIVDVDQTAKEVLKLIKIVKQ
jgi:hypothetical protein